MKNLRRRSSLASVYPVGSLMAVAEVMLILWVVSIISLTTASSGLREGPIEQNPSAESAEFDHTIMIGPGTSLQLDGATISLVEMIRSVKKTEAASVAVQPDPKVDAGFFFDARYRLRTAGVGYCERPPTSTQPQRKETR